MIVEMSWDILRVECISRDGYIYYLLT